MADKRPRVLVTGGSSGIGFELARQFAESGHDVIVAAQDIEKLEASAELIRERASDASVGRSRPISPPKPASSSFIAR